MKPEEAKAIAEGALQNFIVDDRESLANAIAERLLWAAKPTTRAMFAARNASAESLRILQSAIEVAYDDVQANLIDPSLAISLLCALVKYGNPHAEMPVGKTAKSPK